MKLIVTIIISPTLGANADQALHVQFYLMRRTRMQLDAAGTVSKLLAWSEGEPTYNLRHGAIEMAHCVKELAIKPEDASSIPGPTWWEGRTDS